MPFELRLTPSKLVEENRTLRTDVIRLRYHLGVLDHSWGVLVEDFERLRSRTAALEQAADRRERRRERRHRPQMARRTGGPPLRPRALRDVTERENRQV